MASNSLFAIYRELRVLDVGIKRLTHIDVHGLLRICDLNEIFIKNTDITHIIIKNFEWNTEDTLDFSMLKYVKKI